VAQPLALLVNPKAGGGWAARVARPVCDRLRAYGHDVRLLVGRSGEETADLARVSVAGGVAAVVTVGGDGLVHQALQAVAGSGVALGVIPAGTGNDAARALGLPYRRRIRDALAAADVIHTGATRRVDAGRAGGQWFFTVLSSGFDSLVTERADRMTWLRGHARYNLAIAAQLRVFRPIPYDLTLDGERMRADAMLVAVGNGPSYGGGMRCAPPPACATACWTSPSWGHCRRPRSCGFFRRCTGEPTSGIRRW
jgi:diacylglycerol kinase (ATP)